MIFLSYVYFSFLCLLPLGSTVWHKHPKLLCFLIESKKKPIYYNSFWGMCVRWGRGKGRYKNKERLSHFQGIYFSYLRRNVASYSFSSILKKKKLSFDEIWSRGKNVMLHLYSCIKFVRCFNGMIPFSELCLECLCDPFEL